MISAIAICPLDSWCERRELRVIHVSLAILVSVTNMQHGAIEQIRVLGPFAPLFLHS